MSFELSKYSKIFKALANEQRLKIFLMLYRHATGNMPATATNAAAKKCCDYPGLEKAFTIACKTMNISPSTISHHFKELQHAGLITYERKGQYYVCHVNLETVKKIKDMLA